MMEWIVTNWGSLVILAVLIAAGVSYIRKDTENAKKWLLYACIEAERIFGSQTGKIKLTFVYNQFLTAFPILAKFLSFDEFSKFVDIVLEEMKHLMDTNSAVLNYIQGGDTWQKYTE